MPDQEDQQEVEEEGRNVVWMCETVCVLCVLLLQTATLNVLLQTAQFQHLQSPNNPKQGKKKKKQSILSSDFFFHFAQVPTTYIFLHLCGFCNLLTWFSHSLSTNFYKLSQFYFI